MTTSKPIIRVAVLSIALMIAVGLGQPVLGQDDSLLVTYQGYLTDAAGDPISGSQSITFTIYDSEGTALWTEEHPDVPVNNGLFSVILGSIYPNLFEVTADADSGETLWFGIAVGSDDEIMPRTRLTSVFSAAVSKRVTGDIVTSPGQLVIPSSDGDSAIVMSTGDSVSVSLVKSNAGGDHSWITSCLREAGGTDIGVSASEFFTEGLYQQDIRLAAYADSNFMRIQPPESCTPDPCGPAIELMATAEINSLKVLPPPPTGGDPQPHVYVVCGEAAEVQFCSEDGKLAGLGVNAASNESYLELGSTSIDGSGPSMTMTADATPGASSFTIQSEVSGYPCSGDERLEIDEDGFLQEASAWDDSNGDSSWTFIRLDTAGATTEIHSRQAGGHTAVGMTADDALAELTLLNGDPAGPPDIVLRALPDGGGQIGVNTDSPTEALDVNGTTRTTGFKMQTGATDGHVLTSDGDGNGTWQAPASVPTIITDAANGNTHPVTGKITVWYDELHSDQFSSPPSIFVEVCDPYTGKVKHGEVSTSGLASFELTVTDAIGGALFADANVDIRFMAIGH